MITIAIQAGGQSRRMGRDKALIPLGGVPLIERVLTLAQNLGTEVLITTNQPGPLRYLGVSLVSDRVPGQGTLPGLQTALESAHHDRVLVLACDMPFLNRSLLSYMIDLDTDADVVMPRWKQEWEPFHAIYRPSTCLPAIEASLQAGEHRMISFLNRIRTHSIDEGLIREYDPDGLSFFNINSPADLGTAEEIIAGST
jgi:molybdopterin-guanine dinucleotide biosynthesis protein A